LLQVLSKYTRRNNLASNFSERALLLFANARGLHFLFPEHTESNFHHVFLPFE